MLVGVACHRGRLLQYSWDTWQLRGATKLLAYAWSLATVPLLFCFCQGCERLRSAMPHGTHAVAIYEFTRTVKMLV